MTTITVSQAWYLARALDPRTEELLDIACDAEGVKRDVAMWRFQQAEEAREWLDTMATYVETKDAVVHLPQRVAYELSEANIPMPTP